MTIEEAFKQLIKSSEFTEAAKDIRNGKLRVYLGRFNAGKLKSGAMVELLISNGYEIKANKVTKKK